VRLDFTNVDHLVDVFFRLRRHLERPWKQDRN
jgi:hypothetical protein